MAARVKGNRGQKFRWYLLIDISGVVFIPELLVLIPALCNKLFRPCDRSQWAARLLKKSKLLCGKWSGLVDAINLDTVSRAGDVEPPVPRRPDGKRLCVKGIVPDSTHDFDPSFDITRQID